jgi:AcrR family transcriptional regulator
MSERVKTETKSASRKAGRPRSETARLAILRAAQDLLEQGGLPAVTMEGVAARARVGKPTVYRHFSNRHELAMAALMQIGGGELPSRRMLIRCVRSNSSCSGSRLCSKVPRAVS